MNKKQEIITYITDEYSLFKKLEGNRIINLKNVNAIIKSVTSNGYKPTILIVNEKFEIIDGQHRLEAFKKLNLPIEYQIRTGLTLKDAIALNVANKTWTNLDYIESYASLDYKDYIDLLNLINSFKLVSYETIIEISGKTNKQHLLEGKFKIKDDLLNISKQLEFVENFKKLNLKINGRRTYLEVLLARISDSEFIDSDRLLEQAEKYGNIVLNSVVNSDDGLIKLQELYNYRKRDVVRFVDKYNAKYKDNKELE